MPTVTVRGVQGKRDVPSRVWKAAGADESDLCVPPLFPSVTRGQGHKPPHEVTGHWVTGRTPQPPPKPSLKPRRGLGVTASWPTCDESPGLWPSRRLSWARQGALAGGRGAGVHADTGAAYSGLLCPHVGHWPPPPRRPALWIQGLTHQEEMGLFLTAPPNRPQAVAAPWQPGLRSFLGTVAALPGNAAPALLGGRQGITARAEGLPGRAAGGS